MIALTRAAYFRASVAGPDRRSIDLLRRWVGGEDEALTRWLDGDPRSFGMFRLPRTVAEQVRDLRRQVLELRRLRDVLLAASRAGPAEGNFRRRRQRRRAHDLRFTTRRGGARYQVPNAKEVLTLFGAILAFVVAYAVRLASDIVALAVLPL